MADKKLQRTDKKLSFWVLSGEIGLKIAIPLIVFLLLGLKMDRYFKTLPLFLLIGVGLALIISSLSIWQMIRKINN